MIPVKLLNESLIVTVGCIQLSDLKGRKKTPTFIKECKQIHLEHV